MKRAAIYISVSSERQAEKASPKAQEKDCFDLCKDNDYQVVDVYWDIAKYRVRNKLVEPSGTRVDRPGFKSMIANIYNGNIDVIMAWKEDRLFRGLRPMLDFLECIEDTNIDVELVKGSFNKRMAPIKAWVAKMELEDKRDRFLIGVEGRLNKGKVWTTTPPHGYERDGDYLVPFEPEAKWVRNCFEWYASGVPIPEIRQRFIKSGALYKKTDKVKHPWNKSRFY